MRILFISRAYPPIQGGIENQNHALSVWISRKAEVTTIANRRGKRFLPLFLPYAALTALFLAPRYDVVLLGDGVLGIVGWILKKVYPGKRVVSVVHGLDMSYRSRFYQQWWVRTFLPSLDGLIAVSAATQEVGTRHGIPAEKFFVVPNGIDPSDDGRVFTEQDLESLLGESVSGKTVLLTVGRLVRRKGVAWFIRAVLPLLPGHMIYLVAGSGPEQGRIQDAVRESGMEGRVRLLGRVSDRGRLTLLRTAHLFIQPNIPVEHDIEGFGIALIEATSEGLPVVASRLEGLAEAITDGENGCLVAPQDPDSFRDAILSLSENDDVRREFGRHARTFTRKHYHWDMISDRYMKILSEMLPKSE